MPVIYPFTAIVGQERMRRALVLNAVDPRIGGVLIRGERGTAKSTAARALAALLPQVSVVTDCRFGCDPERPSTWCTECRERSARGEVLPHHTRSTPFINLPISATPVHQPAYLSHRRPGGGYAGHRKSHPKRRASL